MIVVREFGVNMFQEADIFRVRKNETKEAISFRMRKEICNFGIPINYETWKYRIIMQE